MNGRQPVEAYSGRENLEAMTHARNYNRYLLRLIADHADGDEILDFGAGAGTFARPLTEAGRNVLCVEPDPELRRDLARAGLCSYADLEAVPAESVDAIYSLNVLEHVEDDLLILHELNARLKSGGRLMLYVPAFSLLFSAMDRKVGHFRRYRKRGLTAQLRKAGFKITRARYVDSLGFFVTLFYKLVGDDSGTINAKSVFLYDRLIFPLSRMLDVALGVLLGKNLLVVATKEQRPNAF